MTAHWGIEDPAEVEGPGQRQAFERAFDALERRIAQMLALPLDSLDPASLKARLRAIGETQHA